MHSQNYLKYCLAYCLITYVSVCAFAQEKVKGPNVYLSPRITIGYTFGSGMNYGTDIFVGLYRKNDFNFGLNLSFYMANTSQGIHRMKSLAAAAETDYLSIKLGAGSVSRRWGLKNRNKASAPGLVADVSMGIGEKNAPWMGVKSFMFNRAKWQFYDHPSYFSIYTYFKSPNIELYKKEIFPEEDE
jgi:hypothetical protein